MSKAPRWFEQRNDFVSVPPASVDGPPTPDLFTKCPTCSEVLFNDLLRNNLQVCTKCGYHFRISAVDRLRSLCDDPASVDLHDADLVALDALGFVDGKPAPIDRDAEQKFLTGVFDDLSKANTLSYLQEIFTIAGFSFGHEEYIMDNHADKGFVWKLPKKKPIVGLNTGCGGRWVSRLWDEKNWVALAKKLKRAGYEPLLLGGEQEHARNKRIAAKSGARYPGYFPLDQFINLMDQCDLVVSAVTMAMHIAVGLRKPLVLFNSTFNKNEFELYGRGEILEPDFDCPCYYSPVCPNNCMQYLRVETVFDSCRRILPT